MLDWLKRWWQGAPAVPPPEGPLEQLQSNDWVVVPYRIAEACRISIYTIGSHPDLPDSLRVWIAQWLAGYNHALSVWFHENYGPEVFNSLSQITDSVRDVSEQMYADHFADMTAADFEQWQKEFRESQDDV